MIIRLPSEPDRPQFLDLVFSPAFEISDKLPDLAQRLLFASPHMDHEMDMIRHDDKSHHMKCRIPLFFKPKSLFRRKPKSIELNPIVKDPPQNRLSGFRRNCNEQRRPT